MNMLELIGRSEELFGAEFGLEDVGG